nr:MAG TPA: hypothetical protein [Caudoviricetes sp.]
MELCKGAFLGLFPWLGSCLKNRHALHSENRGLFGCSSVGSPAPGSQRPRLSGSQGLRLPGPQGLRASGSQVAVARNVKIA